MVPQQDRETKEETEFAKRHVGDFPHKFGGKCSSWIQIEKNWSFQSPKETLSLVQTRPKHTANWSGL